MNVWVLKKDPHQFALYEANVPPVIQFFHETGSLPCGWHTIDLQGRNPVTKERQVSTCDLEYIIPQTAIRAKRTEAGQGAEIPPLVECSFDIEAYTMDGSFPEGSFEGARTITIGSTFKVYGQKEPYLKHVITLKDCTPIEGVVVESYGTEGEVIMAWQRLLLNESPDVIYSWNGYGFDWNFLYKSAQRVGVPFNVGRLKGVSSTLTEKQLESAAFGFNKFLIVSMPGILDLDLMQAVKRSHKLDSYSLENVATVILNEHKNDMPIRRLFELFEQGIPEGIAEIARYCVQDTALPLRLSDRLNLLFDQIEMSKATFVPIDYLLHRGQQVRPPQFSGSLYMKHGVRTLHRKDSQEDTL